MKKIKIVFSTVIILFYSLSVFGFGEVVYGEEQVDLNNRLSEALNGKDNVFKFGGDSVEGLYFRQYDRMVSGNVKDKGINISTVERAVAYCSNVKKDGDKIEYKNTGFKPCIYFCEEISCKDIRETYNKAAKKLFDDLDCKNRGDWSVCQILASKLNEQVSIPVISDNIKINVPIKLKANEKEEEGAQNITSGTIKFLSYKSYITVIFYIVASFGGTISIIRIIYAATLYSAGSLSPAQTGKAKEIIIDVLTGISVLFLSGFLLYSINPGAFGS